MLKVKKKFTRLLLIVVSSIGICSSALLLTDPPPTDPSNIDSDDSVSLFDMSSSILRSRDIANAGAAEIENKHEALFDFNCAEVQQSFETFRARFRLKGDNCTSEKASSTTQIQNLSNGYVATVFHKTPTAFTTDYINLSEGENKIKVVFETGEGPVEKTVIVVRKPVSLKK